MSPDIKHIDEKIKQHSLRKAEISDLGLDIAASTKNIVVAFVDLEDSTKMKLDSKPEEWLGFVYEFVRRCTQLVEDAGGRVVKRIGDEIMATFGDVLESELFVKSLTPDATLDKFRYKVAIDFGAAYHFQFIVGHEDDPYGTVVDRCARLAKLATAGLVFSSLAYTRELADSSRYKFMGEVALKGLPDATPIYVRTLSEPKLPDYLDDLITTLNSSSTQYDGFKVVGRKLTLTEIRELPKGDAFPLLARELINLPKLPYAFTDFANRRSKAKSTEDFDRQYIGYVVEWEAEFLTTVNNRETMSVLLRARPSDPSIALRLPSAYREITDTLTAGQSVRFRGVLEGSSSLGQLYINYVEMYLGK